MKRFWRYATSMKDQDGFVICLDDRPIRTPKRVPLKVPIAGLAAAIAGEWNAVGEEMNPRTMPLTGLANAAIDVVAADPAGFAARLAVFGASDLTCYRAERPPELVGRQVAAWEPVLKAVERAHGLVFRRTSGVVPVDQPQETLSRLEQLFAGEGPFRLAGLSPLVTISGSAVIALALAAGLVDAETAMAAAHVDEDFQAEQWGRDAEAEARRAAREADFLAAAEFLALLSDNLGA
jgi:chaperone required for assembly of F1-ATPase